jgi:hypothetical protein
VNIQSSQSPFEPDRSQLLSVQVFIQIIPSPKEMGVSIHLLEQATVLGEWPWSSHDGRGDIERRSDNETMQR